MQKILIVEDDLAIQALLHDLYRRQATLSS